MLSFERDDPLVVRDRLAARKVQTVGDGSVILFPFADVAVTGGEMGCQEAKRGGAVVESNSDSALCWMEGSDQLLRRGGIESRATYCSRQDLAHRSAINERSQETCQAVQGDMTTDKPHLLDRCFDVPHFGGHLFLAQHDQRRADQLTRSQEDIVRFLIGSVCDGRQDVLLPSASAEMKAASASRIVAEFPGRTRLLLFRICCHDLLRRERNNLLKAENQ